MTEQNRYLFDILAAMIRVFGPPDGQLKAVPLIITNEQKNRRFMLGDYMPCTSCAQAMTGIFDYDAREVCSKCGGQAKIDNSKELNEDGNIFIEKGKKHYKEMILNDKTQI